MPYDGVFVQNLEARERWLNYKKITRQNWDSNKLFEQQFLVFDFSDLSMKLKRKRVYYICKINIKKHIYNYNVKFIYMYDKEVAEINGNK